MTDKRQQIVNSILRADLAFVVTCKGNKRNVEIVWGDTEMDMAGEISDTLAKYFEHEIGNEDVPDILQQFVDKIMDDDPECGICDDCREKIEEEMRLMELN